MMEDILSNNIFMTLYANDNTSWNANKKSINSYFR